LRKGGEPPISLEAPLGTGTPLVMAVDQPEGELGPE